MSHLTTAMHDHAHRLEAMAWGGLAAGSAAVVGGLHALEAQVAPHVVGLVGSPFTPQDFTAWVTAICSAIGAVTAAVNGAAIIAHRFGRAPSKSKPKPKPKPKRKPRAPSQLPVASCQLPVQKENTSLQLATGNSETGNCEATGN